jgi:hypothetical protein
MLAESGERMGGGDEEGNVRRDGMRDERGKRKGANEK